MEGYAGEVFGAVGEPVEGDFQRGVACGGKDVRQEVVRHIGVIGLPLCLGKELCVGVESLHAFGADSRVVGDVAEGFLFDAFVGGKTESQEDGPCHRKGAEKRRADNDRTQDQHVPADKTDIKKAGCSGYGRLAVTATI